jgi:Polyketide cyclase / dehydrase and lipid transport
MARDPFPLHHRSEALLAVDAARLFAHLDDHRRLASHMEKPSLMTAGASMRIDIDDRHGQAVGSVIRMSGRMLGLGLAVEEAVIRRDPPHEKIWVTIGKPRLVVIGAYRMGFTITPAGTGTRLVVFIDYRLPGRGIGKWLGRLLGAPYAAWCTRRMTRDAGEVFGILHPQ